MVIFCPAHSTCVHSLEFFCKQYFSLLPHLFSQAFLSMAGSSMESCVKARLWGPECGSFTATPWSTVWMVVRNNSYLAWEGLRTLLSSQRGVGPYPCLHRLAYPSPPESGSRHYPDVCPVERDVSIHPSCCVDWVYLSWVSEVVNTWKYSPVTGLFSPMLERWGGHLLMGTWWGRGQGKFRPGFVHSGSLVPQRCPALPPAIWGRPAYIQ